MLRRLPHLADTPALFIPSMTTEADIARYTQAGAIGVIAKPIVPLRLTGQLYDLWNEHAMPLPGRCDDAASAGA